MHTQNGRISADLKKRSGAVLGLRNIALVSLKGDLALEMIFWIWIFGAKMNFFCTGQEKSWIIGRNIFWIPLISTTAL